MQQTARVVEDGDGQAIILPAEFRFDSEEIDIRRDADTGDVILSSRGQNWDELFRMRDALTQAERDELVIPGRNRVPEVPQETKSLATFFQLLDEIGPAEPEFLADRDRRTPTDRNLF